MSYDLGTARGTITLEYEGRKQADQAEEDIDKLSRASRDADRDVNKLGKSFRSFLGGAGKGAGITSLSVGLTNAAVQAGALGVQLLGIVPDLLSIASLASALPAALTAGAAALGVMKAATVGIEDTLKAAFDPEGAAKFAEELKKLSPAAREFAVGVRDAVPALREFQQGIQEAFFRGSDLGDVLPRVQGVMATLRGPVQGLAQDFGNITRRIADFVTESETVGFISQSITDFRTAIQETYPAFTPLLNGLRDVGFVGSELLVRLGDAVGNVGVRFGEWLTEIANSGQLQEWIDTALVTLGQLGGILQNLGSIFTSVLTAANAAGGGLLGTLEAATGAAAGFLKSAEGSAALASLFGGLLAVAKQLAPVFTTLFGALANALGPALSQLATQVGPVLLQVVQALAPAFAPLASAIASLAGAVAPLLGPIAQVVAVLAQLASGVVQSLVAAFGPLIEVLSGTLTQAFAQLAPAIQQMVDAALPLAAQVGPQLAAAFTQLAPAIVQVVQAFASGLTDYLPVAMDLFTQIMPLVTQLATTFADLLGPALRLVATLIPPLVSVISTIVGVLTPIIGVVTNVVTAFLRFVSTLVTAPGQIGSVFSSIGSTISGAFNSVVNFLGNAISNIVGFFAALPGRIMSAITALPGQVWSLIKNMATQAAFLFGQMIGLLVTAAVTLPPRIVAAIRALPGQLANLIRNAWNTARNLFLTGVAAAINIARTLPGRVRSAVNSLVGFLRTAAVNAWNNLRNAFVTGIARAVQLARELPGRIRSAVGNLASLLLQAGRDAVQGLINGIRSGVGAVADAARSLGSSIMSGIKSTLKISSPSKEMIAIGKFVNDGLVKGMLGTANQVKAASAKVAKLILEAYKEGDISKRRRNSALAIINSSTKQMLQLLSRQESVAKQLADARKRLEDIQKQYNDTYNTAYEKVRSSFSLVTSGQQFVNLDLTKQRFKDAVTQAKEFAANIATLTKRGLNKDLLQQLVDAGAADGGAMAEALANADDKTLKEFDNLQKQLNDAAKKTAKTTADAMYGAGLKAAQGLVRGLEASEKKLEAQMKRLADAMVKQIKKALKIKSPSRVMITLGKFTAEGLKDGIEALRRDVERAARDLATASILPTVRMHTTGTVTSSGTGGVSVGSGTTIQQNINQTVNALPGMSAEQVAKYGLDKLRYALQGGITAVTLPTPSPAGA